MIYRNIIFCTLFCTLFFFGLNVYAATAIVNVPVANLHKQASLDAPVISQTIYGSNIDVINKTKSGWALIGTHDYYTGWVQNSELSFKTSPKSEHNIEANILFAAIYQEADMNKHKPIMVPFSTKLPLVKIIDEKWIEVRLPTGKSGFMRRNDVKIDPQPLTMAKMVKLSRKFVGLPYIWGGVSTYGFDCSGFIQFLYKQIGITLPRDATLMTKWNGFTKVSKENLQPGDPLYFGYDNKISHAGMYLGDGYFINATNFKSSTVKISKLSDEHWTTLFITARRLKNSTPLAKYKSTIQSIPQDVKQQMQKQTYKRDCPVPLKNLAYLTLPYYGFDDRVHKGHLIIHKNLAAEVTEIFKNLYQQRFPIAKMKPMYLYKGDDSAAMVDNNTSGFNCRHQTDFPKLFSPHSYGGAIDINPLINPYVKDGKVSPPEAKKYLNRAKPHKGKISQDSTIVRIFTKYGWNWGGNWAKRKIKDYQHFEKNPNYK